MRLDGLSLSSLVAELNDRLTGGRIDKIFQPDKQTLIVWIRKPGENLKLLISIAAHAPRIHLANHCPDNPATPPVFCMLLRKHLEDARIGSIRQQGQDRIVILDFDVRAEQGLITTKQLIVEIMGKHSNIILVANDIILDAIRRVNMYMSRHRQVLPGKPYLLPPGQDRLSLFWAESAAIATSATTGQGQFTKALISTVSGMGPVTAREIAWRAGLPPDVAVQRLDSADTAAVSRAVEEVAAELSAPIPQPTVLIDQHGRLAAIASFPIHYLPHTEVRRFSTMSEAVEFAAALDTVYRPPLLEELLKLIQSELARLGRKQEVLAAELLEAQEADRFRHYADSLMIHLYQITPGIDEISLPDLFAETPDTTVTIPLDSVLTPLANAQRYYAKYNKLQRRQEMTAIQLAECSQEADYLHSVALALENAVSNEEAEEIRLELSESGYVKLKGSSRKTKTAYNFTPWKVTVDGTTILIGRNNRQNDWLTFKEAHPHDLWLHTKDIPGSHVIIRCGDSDPSTAVLTAAAICAAWFSKARSSSHVPVDYTRRRYVKKPSGAKPGFVIYEKQKTLYVTPDIATIEQLAIR